MNIIKKLNYILIYIIVLIYIIYYLIKKTNYALNTYNELFTISKPIHTIEGFNDNDNNLKYTIETESPDNIIKNTISTNGKNNLIFTHDNSIQHKVYTTFKLKVNNETTTNKSNSYAISILIVGAGGGGGYNLGGGGGGGEVIYINDLILEKDKEYNISIGKGGNKGILNYRWGGNGYDTSFHNIFSSGGGGGASHLYTSNTNDIIKKIIKDPEFTDNPTNGGYGLSGGSGGGSCGRQYGIVKDTDIIMRGLSNNANNFRISQQENFNSFVNHGAIVKDNINIGGGGGGAGEKSVDVDIQYNDKIGDGGSGICIEDIDINGENFYCPIISHNDPPVCNNLSNKWFSNDSSKKQSLHFWGAGGGGGSFNEKAGNGGKGGGGSGGYTYDNYIEDNKSIRAKYYYGDDSTLNAGNNYDIRLINDDTYDKINASGGDGINNTGSGGGGGGIGSNGGNGGSGIIILNIYELNNIENTEEELIEETEEIQIKDNDKSINAFINNKKILGQNLSYFFNYNIKDNVNFYNYIDKLYESDLLNENLYDYDTEKYDIKYHLFIKLIFDLKIESNYFLFYSKKKHDTKYIENYKLEPYIKITKILIEIIENLIIFARDNKNYYDILNKLITHIELRYNLDENRKSDNYYNESYYHLDINNKKLILYISQQIDDNKIIDITKFKKHSNIESILEEEEYNEINSFKIIELYIFTFLNVKEYNFNRNIITLYIYFKIIDILKDFYINSEKLILNNKIEDYKNNGCDNIYNTITEIDKININLKSLTGYNFIDNYLNNYTINNAKCTKNNCPYITIELNNDYDSNELKIRKYEYPIDNVEDLKINNKKTTYYEKFEDKFIIEFNGKRYNITNIKYRTDKNEDQSYYWIRELTFELNESLCNSINIGDNYSFNILAKDSTYINNDYNNNIDKLKYYNNNIEKNRNKLKDTNSKFNKYKIQLKSILNKRNIYFIIFFIITIFIIMLKLLNIDNNKQNIYYIVFICILIIMVIYNYYTRIFIEYFTEQDTLKILWQHKNYINTNNIDNCKTISEKLSNGIDEVDNMVDIIHDIRNDVLRYLNIKFILFNKLIDTIELERANNLYNKIDKVLDKEKKNYKRYDEEYKYKDNYNKNINQLFIHKLINQSSFINMIIIMYIIIIVIILLSNLLPKNYNLIMILGLLCIIVNIFIYTIKIVFPTRTKASKKYWNKPGNELIKKMI
jgi:hypothetical protein